MHIDFRKQDSVTNVCIDFLKQKSRLMCATFLNSLRLICVDFLEQYSRKMCAHFLELYSRNVCTDLVKQFRD